VLESSYLLLNSAHIIAVIILYLAEICHFTVGIISFVAEICRFTAGIISIVAHIIAEIFLYDMFRILLRTPNF
jgi:hypothetical protein